MQRSLIQSVGKFKVGGDIVQFLQAFETSVELTVGNVAAISFDKVFKLMYSTVDDDVQRFLSALSPAPTDYDTLCNVLRTRYGKSIRQV